MDSSPLSKQTTRVVSVTCPSDGPSGGEGDA